VSSKRIASLCGFLLLFTILVPNPAKAEVFVKLSGKILTATGSPVPERTNVLLLGEKNFLISTRVSGDGTYDLIFPAQKLVKVYIQHYGLQSDESEMEKRTSQDAQLSIWETEISVQKDRVLNFSYPMPIKLSVKVVDAQNNLLPNSLIIPRVFDSVLQSITTATGEIWKGTQNWSGDKGGAIISKSGDFEVWNYPLKNFGGIEVRSEGPTFVKSSSVPFPLVSNTSIKFCLPIDFGASRTLPADCLAADSDQRDLGQKVVEEAVDAINKAQQDLQDRLKKISEKVCKKGKLTKKVSIKSKCPKGYKQVKPN
jgi:hypothetical protein